MRFSRIFHKREPIPGVSPGIFSLAICIVLLLVVFLNFIIATAGSTANYVPITNIYLGQADIRHINVTRIIPQVAPILVILGSALTAPNASLPVIFDSLKKVSNTPVLSPLLRLLSNAENSSATLEAILELAPLAIQGPQSNSTVELTLLTDLVKDSNDGNETLSSLSVLLDSNNSTNQTSVAKRETEQVLNLLASSINPLGSAESLVRLNDLSMTEKLTLLPVFQIFSGSKNVNNTLESLGTLLSSNLSLSAQQTLLNILQSSISISSNVTQTLQVLQGQVPLENQNEFNAVKLLLDNANSVNSTMSSLFALVESNATKSDSAKIAFQGLRELLTDTNNQTMVLETVMVLSTEIDNKGSTLELSMLYDILKESKDQKLTISTMQALQNRLVPNNPNLKYLPYLFDLLKDSKDKETSLLSLQLVTLWAQQNPLVFIPILRILTDASQVTPVTQEQLKEMLPGILEYLKVPVIFQLSIFTLCRANLRGDMVYGCSNSHAVQNLDFRSIIYDSLIESDFEPYLKALNITKYDLYLEGRLLRREHEYVPTIRALLTFSILTIIVSFAAICTLLVLYYGSFYMKYAVWLTAWSFIFSAALFSGLSATIVAIAIEIIKHGTDKDNYGVVYSRGGVYSGLTWSAFAFSSVLTVGVIYIWWNTTRPSMAQYPGSSSGSVSTIEDIDAEKLPVTIDVQPSVTVDESPPSGK